MISVFLDLQKAYDILWKNELLIKLQSLHIHGQMLRWVRYFLTNRSIYVRINNIYSSFFTLDNGTPQGSVISPALFLIMVDGINSLSLYSQLLQFADKTSIHKSCTLQFAKSIESDLCLIQKWCQTNGIFLLSPTKTQTLIFTR